jgi:very-short-patch-repair endonuclease
MSNGRDEAPLIASPLRGEVAAQRRVRGSVSRSRTLRSMPTDAEAKLWSIVRARQLGGFKFVRQLAIGPYFADFACREVALVVEVDGGQHAESQRDATRTQFLSAEGYSVLRFWNNDVLTNPQGVAESILAVLVSHPSPDLRFAPATLSPEGRGKKGASAAANKQRSFRLTADLPRLVKE